MTIVVLTPRSKARPWLMWEAGAVSGAGLARGASTPVVPLLFGIRGDQVPSPLGSRQIKLGAVPADTRDLLDSMRKLGGLTYRPDHTVARELDSYLQAVVQARIPGMHDIFISCPMTNIDAEEYGKMQQAIDSLSEQIAGRGSSAYSAMRRIGKQTPDPEVIAAEKDFAALMSSRHFLMIYPRRVMSSCILEAGYALGAGIPSTYFVRSDDDLPYMLRGAVESLPDIQRVRFRDERGITAFFLRNPGQFLG
jgi:hypothetical protein